MTKRLELEEAREHLLSGLSKIEEKEMVPLMQAAGRVLAEPVTAGFSVPPFPRSAMDGYAVRAADTAGAGAAGAGAAEAYLEGLQTAKADPNGAGAAGRDSEDSDIANADPSEADAAGTVPGNSQTSECRMQRPIRLEVIGEIPAGVPAYPEYRPGSAVRIMTGGRVPEGYDAVVKQEDTDYGEDVVSVYRAASPHENICPAGEDICAGETVLGAGQCIGRIEAGILARLGIDKVPVIRPVRVGLLSTGTELAAVGMQLADGKIFENTSVMMETSIRQAGFCCRRELCPDDESMIAEKLEELLADSDIVITTGGISVGKWDLVPAALSRIGAEKVFSGVNVMPGTPTIGSRRDGKILLSLSGNPYAALCHFDWYFWSAAAKLTGCDAFEPEETMAVMMEDYENKRPLRRMVRAHLDGGQVSLPAKSHKSSVISNLQLCNCYLDAPAGAVFTAGDKVRVLRIRGC